MDASLMSVAGDRLRPKASLEGVVQPTAGSGKLKDIDVHRRHVDDVIVDLHTEGENPWQAFARAAQVDGAACNSHKLFHELWNTGRVLLESGETCPLPPLDAKGVAQICAFELEAADYEADRVLVVEPVVPEPRVAAHALWPALRRNGYNTGREPARWNDSYTPRARLAESTGVPKSTIYRIATNAKTTVGVNTAIALLMELDDTQARELEDELLLPWLDARDKQDRQGLGFEYFEGLARFAQQARAFMALTDDERQALDDIVWISVAAQRQTFLGTTTSVRLAETREAFRATRDRDPIPLTRRLRQQARKFFDREAANAAARAHALRRGLHREGTSITARTVAMRTHRLRLTGRLAPTVTGVAASSLARAHVRAKLWE